LKIHDVAQGSQEWLNLRAGVPTASEFDALVSPTFEIRKGDMPRTYLHKKLAEWWQGGPLLEFNSFDMDQGQILEESAKPNFTVETDIEIRNVGFVTTDDGKIGCSPDGLIGENSGVEIKCPKIETHVGYLLTGVLPKQYGAQVHGSMFVTGANSWRFYSYRRRMPSLNLLIERDDKAQEALKEALEMFLAAFEIGQKRLCEINGGPPVRRVAFKPGDYTSEQLAQEQDRPDIPTP
jgi:hypothetical protein